MIKKIIYTLLISGSVFASPLIFNAADLTKMEKDSHAQIKNLEYLKPQNIKQLESFNNDNNLNDFEKFLSKKESVSDQLDMVESLYTGTESDFLNKKEASLVIKDLKYAMTLSKKPTYYFLYFFSESVPKRSTMNFLLDIDILQQNGFAIDSKQYMIGYPKDYKQYMFDWRDEIEEFPIKYRKSVANTFAMKFAPNFFKVYKIKKVPVIALAKCAGSIPAVKSCKIEYLIRGDIPLTTFLDKIAQREKKYIDMSKVLIGNQIYKPKNLNLEVKENE